MPIDLPQLTLDEILQAPCRPYRSHWHQHYNNLLSGGSVFSKDGEDKVDLVDVLWFPGARAPGDDGTYRRCFVSTNVGLDALRIQFSLSETQSTVQGGVPLARIYVFKAADEKLISWSGLHVSENTVHKIFEKHGVFMQHYDTLLAFQKLEQDQRGSCGVCKYRVNRKRPGLPPRTAFIDATESTVESIESSYVFHFPIDNGRYMEEDFAGSPYDLLDSISIRQTGIYHKYDFEADFHTWILARPSEEAQRWFDSELTEAPLDSKMHNPLKKHTVFLSSAVENWNMCYRRYERYLSLTTKNSLFFTVKRSKDSQPETHGVSSEEKVSETTNKRKPLKVDFKDVQDIQIFQEEVQQAIVCLDHNLSVLASMRSLNERLQRQRPEAERYLHEDFEISMETFIAELEMHRRNMDTLLQRVKGRAALLYEILEFQNQESLSHQTEISTSLKQMEKIDSYITRELTKKTTKDAASMRIITIVALVYLPCTFVATFLDSTVLNFDEPILSNSTLGDGVPVSRGLDFTQRVTMSKESLFLFLILTIPLTVLTFIGWILWDRREERKSAKSWDDLQKQAERAGTWPV